MPYNFGNITAATIANAKIKPGHSDTVLYAPLSEFTAIQNPGAYTSAGDKKKITTAHTFPLTKGFAQLKAKSGTVRQEGTTAVGEEGGWVPQYQYIITVKGHSAVIEEWLEELLNEEGIFLFNSPECGVNEYIQLGSSCNPAKVKGFTAASGNKNAGGVTQYEITVGSSDQYYYSATVTVKA